MSAGAADRTPYPLPHNPETVDHLPYRRTYSTPGPEHDVTMDDAVRALKAPITPFAGRLGGNQEFIVNRYDPDNADLVDQMVDAAPLIPLNKITDLRGFREPELWKAAVMEGVGQS